METKEANSYKISVDLNSETFFGATGKTSFLLTECTADLGMTFTDGLVPLIGRVEGVDGVYLYGLKDACNNIVFEIIGEYGSFAASFYKDVLTIEEVVYNKDEDSASLLCVATLEEVEDCYKINEWFDNIYKQVLAGKKVHPLDFGFVFAITNEEGARTSNSLIEFATNNEKECMVFAIIHFISTHSYEQTKAVLKNLRMLPRVMFERKIKKFLNSSGEKCRKYYDDVCDFLFKASYEFVVDLFDVMSNEAGQAFSDFDSGLFKESFESYFDGRTVTVV